MMERAPTSPNDKTILVFIVITIKKIATLKRGKLLEIIFLLDTEFENFS